MSFKEGPGFDFLKGGGIWILPPRVVKTYLKIEAVGFA
jgi:hypothetical protein